MINNKHQNKENSFTITMEKTGPMEFKTTWDKNFPDLMFDEPKHSGGNDLYPNASRVLIASVANCLAASLTFCLSKSRIPMSKFDLKVVATGTTMRNKQNRWRVKQINVDLHPSFEDKLSETYLKKFDRCVRIFEDYCTVSASVKQGIDIKSNIYLK